MVDQRESSSLAEILRISVEVILCAIVLLAPWAFGCVHPDFEFTLAWAVATVILLSAADSLVGGKSFARFQLAQKLFLAGLLGLAFAAALQLLPIGGGALSVLSPGALEWTGSMLPSAREQLHDGSTPGSATFWAVGSTLGLNPGGSWHFCVRVLALAGLFWSVGRLTDRETLLRKVANVACIVGFLLALFALTQHFSSRDGKIFWYFDSMGARFGPFPNKNHYPFYVNIALGLTIGLLLERQQEHDSSWLTSILQDPRTLWLMLAAGLMFASLVVSNSRGGILSFVASAAIFLPACVRNTGNFKWLLTALAMAVGVAIVWSVAGFQLAESRLKLLGDSEAMAGDGRWHLASAALNGAGQFPLFGSGGDTFPFWHWIGGPHRMPAGVAAHRADADYLDILCEFGGLGWIAIAFCIGGLLTTAWRVGRFNPLAAGAIVGLMAVVLHSSVDFGLRVPASVVFAVIVAALVTGLPRTSAAASKSPADREVDSAAPGFRWLLTPPGVRAVALASFWVLVAGVLVIQKRQMSEADQFQRLAFLAIEEERYADAALLGDASASTTPWHVGHQTQAARIALIATGKLEAEDEKAAAADIAVRRCLIARDLCPLAWEPHVWLAQNIERLSVHDEPINYLLRARRLHPSQQNLAFRVGTMLLDEGKTAEALPHLRDSLRFQNRYLEEVLERCGDDLTAEEIVARVLPEDPSRVFEAALIAEVSGNDFDRVTYLQAALGLLADATVDVDLPLARQHHLSAQILQRLGRMDDATAEYGNALQAEPDAVAWRLEFADALISQDRYRDAEEQLRLALALDPANEAARELKRVISQME